MYYLKYLQVGGMQKYRKYFWDKSQLITVRQMAGVQLSPHFNSGKNIFTAYFDI